jgi:phosphonate transport system substrate-binding protein
MAWYGNKAAIDAVDRANGEVFVQFIDLNGTPGYYSYIITHRDSPIKTLDDMFRMGKDLSFGAGDPQSTSGTLVPGYYVFTQRNTDPKDVFKAVRPASHGVNLLAVLNKQVDVATNNSEEIDKLKLKDPAKAEQVRIVWTSPLIPRDPIVWRKDLPDDVKAKLKSFFIGYGKDAREKEILKNMQQIAGFRESSNAQLIPIRELELAKSRKQIENNASLSAAEKESKLREIDGKLLELKKLAQQG